MYLLFVAGTNMIEKDATWDLIKAAFTDHTDYLIPRYTFITI